MTKEELQEVRSKILSYNISEDRKQEALSQIDKGKEFNFKTGYASIDKPWLKSYRQEAYDAYSNTIEYPYNQSVWDVTKKLLEEYSDVNFIEYFGKSISRETFVSYVEMWARALRALGVKPNDLVPIYTPATPEAFAIFFAANAIGATPYYQKLSITKDALTKETSGAKIAIAFDSLFNNVKDVFNQDRFEKVIILSASDSMMFPLKQVAKMKSYFEQKKNNILIPKNPKYLWVDDIKKISNYYTGEYEVPFEKNRIAVVTTSSGTTSNVVKGIMDTNEGIISSLLCTINADTGYTKGKRTLTCFPPTASTSINCLQLLPTFTGGTIIFDPRVNIAEWYNQVMKYKPDITISTGSVWERFVIDLLKKEQKTGNKHDLSWQDYFIMGGSGTTPNILNNMNTVVRERGAQRDFQVGYGFSEVFGVLSVAKYNGNYREENNDRKVISVGIPLPGYNVGLFDENGNELKYGKGVRGELWIKAPSNMHGYFDKPELTAKTVVDGWIHSGDLCEMDEDGNIYYYGRLKNKVQIDGLNRYLFDIANDIRDIFSLHDVMLEKKNLSNGSISLNVYFVQEAATKKDTKEIIIGIDDYLKQKNIEIDGYKEFEGALPIDPTTLKPKTKYTNDFIKIKSDGSYLVSYDEVELDTYEINEEKVKEKKLK